MKMNETKKVLKIEQDSKEPIFLIHKLDESDILNIDSLEIEVGKNIKAQVVELFVNKIKNCSYERNRKIILGKNSSLEYVKVQDINSSSSLVCNTCFTQDESSNLEVTNFEYGDGFIINSFENILNKENINYELNGLIKLKNSSNNTTLIKTVHDEKNSKSSINYKNSLKDVSKAVVKIKSVVNETALFTKAFQNCNTILLSDDATIVAQPHLEIFIDELEASHGTTTGTLNQEQLLYLQSRGIKKELAYDMLLTAFESSIKDNIKSEEIKEFIENYRRENYV